MLQLIKPNLISPKLAGILAPADIGFRTGIPQCLTQYHKHIPSASLPSSRDGWFGSKVGQIGTKWDKSGTFSCQISVHLALSSQMY